MYVTVAFAVKEGWLQQNTKKKLLCGVYFGKKINAKNGKGKDEGNFYSLGDGGANNTQKTILYQKKGKCCWFL